MRFSGNVIRFLRDHGHTTVPLQFTCVSFIRIMWPRIFARYLEFKMSQVLCFTAYEKFVQIYIFFYYYYWSFTGEHIWQLMSGFSFHPPTAVSSDACSEILPEGENHSWRETACKWKKLILILQRESTSLFFGYNYVLHIFQT